MSDAAKLSQDMTESEQEAFLASLRATEKGLKAARDLLTERKTLSSDTGELGLIRIKRADLIAEIEKVRARRRAFLSGTLSLKPPPPEVVEDIKQRAAALDGLVAGVTAAKTVVDSASLLVNAFNGVLSA